MTRVGGVIPTDDDEDALAPVDDYEQAIDETRAAFRLCSDDDCRDPRRGPFVIDLGGDDAVVVCYGCFATNVLGIDPNEVDW